MRATAWLLMLLVAGVAGSSAAHGDGGAVVLREVRGSSVVTLMAGSLPLHTGPVELSVLVQSRSTGAPQLDAESHLILSGPGAGGALRVTTRPGVEGNRLLRGARIALPRAGRWHVTLVVHDASGHEERFDTHLDLVPAPGPIARHWAAIAAGPAGLALLALHQALALARPGRSSRKERGTSAR